MKANRKRSNAPIYWLLFGGGGMLAALLGTALVWVTGIAAPLGWTLREHALDYQRVQSFAHGFIGKGFLLLIVSLFAWHAAHRVLCSLHDVGIHKGLAAKSVCYGLALAMTVFTAIKLCAI